MIHNPKQRIAKLWKQLRAESWSEVHCHTRYKMKLPDGRYIRIRRWGSVDGIRDGIPRRILGMWLFHDDFERQWANRKSHESDERLFKRTLARLRKVKQ